MSANKSFLNALTTTIALLAAFSPSKSTYADDETHWTDEGVERVVRTWTAAETGAVTNPANWNGEGEILPTDYLLINNGGTATIGAGEEVSAGWLYVGRGWKFADGAWKDSSDYDAGAGLTLTGGKLDLSGTLYVGAGYSDKYDSILSASGDAVINAGGIYSGNCASYSWAQGHPKTSKLSFLGNAVATLGNLRIGNWQDSTNEFYVAGNVTIVATNDLHIGAGGKTHLVMDGGRLEAAGTIGIKLGGFYSGGTLFAELNGGQMIGSCIHAGRNGGSAEVLVDGATVSLFGADWWGSLALGVDSYGKWTQKSGALNAAGHVRVRNGELNVSGGSLGIGGVTMIGDAAATAGAMTVTGGDVHCYGDVRVGETGQGVLSIKGGSVVVAGVDGQGEPTDKWLVLNSSSDTDFAGTSTLNLDGGQLSVAHIRRGDNNTGAKAVINFNGGTYQTSNPKTSWTSDMFAASENFAVKVLPGGARFDTNGFDMNIPVDLEGDGGDSAGGIVKKGEGKLAVSGSIGSKGYVKVEAGTLQINSSVVELDKIEVAEGATLLLNGAAVRSVRTLVKNGTIKDMASDAVEVEISATNKKLASAVWTGAVDANLDNPLNWKVYDEDGVRVSADELPTSDCVVQVRYSTNMPDFSGLNVKSIAMVVSGTVAPRGNWTVPAVVKDAIAWYDYSDESTIQFDGNDEVSGVLNKAENGSALDAVIFNGNPDTASTAPTYGTETLNGRKVMTFANSKGFVSKNAPGLESTDARTLISLGRRDVPQTGDSTLYSIGFARDAEYSMNGVFRISRWTWGQEFRYYDSTVEGYWNASIGPGADPTDLAISYMDFNGDKTVRAWLYSKSVGETAKQTAEIAAEGTLDANGTELLYMGYRRQSQGASTGILAEQLVFGKVLTEEELAEVSGYLKGKWYTVPEVDMARLPTSIVFEGENAVYNLGGGDWTFADVAGGGAISNGNITVTGTLTVVVNDDGTIDPLEIDGKLTLGGNARLVVKGGRKLAFAAVEAISATGGVSGTFASVVSETGKPMKIVYEAGVVKVAKRGGMSICLQ